MPLDIMSMLKPGVWLMETGPAEAVNVTYIIGVNPVGAGIPAGGCIMLVTVSVPEPGGIDIIPV